MTYKHYPNRPGKLTQEFVQTEYKKLTDRITEANSSDTADKWLELYADWNALNSFVGSETSRINHELNKNMSDDELSERERYQREEVQPAADRGNAELLQAVLDSKHNKAIAERYGAHLLEVFKVMQEPLAPINIDLRVKVGDLSMQYDKIVSQGEVTVGGEVMTLSRTRNLQSSQDRAVRKEAFEAYRNWFLDHRNEIASIYDQMVHLRDEMGRNLGHKNFIPLGYKSMGRTDYSIEEAKKFRENIRKYVVPVQTRLYQARAKRLGLDVLKPWDTTFDPAFTLPSGIAPVETQIEKAQRIFDKLSPSLAKHFMRMRDEGLIDLENRKGKRAGAYCTSFPDEGRVAILCNSTGDSEDVATLTHEMGHAFQGWESQPIEAIELQWPTSDACEVHSMGMEYLSMRYMTEFFDQELAEKFSRNRWRDGVEIICYIAIVDEFQHWVYENPNASLDERDAAWNRIWDIYKPGIDWTGSEQYKAARWYSQGHIFGMPFYYIDYAIAETGAMQIALMDAIDHDKTVETYIKLCRIGGTMSVLNIFKAVGMRSPFDESLMKELMDHATKLLEVEETVVA
ncbi:MAG TPA: M3 family oligoendopeptidase [Candidatus Kapabacteria bacterium]|nr:M3 family oligoendopeptidase [Candidatus Kapabacteria bacterium]